MPRPDVGERFRRLLAIIPWLAEQGDEVPLSEVARRFSVDESDLVRDLELAASCGLPPYTGDVLIEVIVDEGTAWVTFPRQLERPLQLTRAEGFAVVAAGNAALAAAGAEEQAASLASALRKLQDVLGDPEGVVVALDEPAHLPLVRRARDDGQELEIDYYSPARAEMTTRRIRPQQVFTAEGRWYLDAHDVDADGHRRFRVDRIFDAEPTGATFEPATPTPAPDVAYEPGKDDVQVTIDLPPTARWVVETFPTVSVEELPGGRMRTVLSVASAAWLERVLLRIGPEGKVVEPEELLDAGRRAAERVLARYLPPADAHGGAEGAAGGGEQPPG